jgi:tetratricopeptide (TPR) repeat protein/predicted aspartyl protease
LKNLPAALLSDCLLVLLALAAAPHAAHAKCEIEKFDLPVTMSGLRALVTAGINGREATFIADSGAGYSLMSRAAAAEFKLRAEPPDTPIRMYGVSGGGDVSQATVRHFTLGHASITDVVFLVGGNELGHGSAGVLGDNVLGRFDTEYDLADSIIRLMRPKDCSNVNLAYWAAPEARRMVDLDSGSVDSPQPSVIAYVNGTKIRAMLDSGAPASMLTLHAAERAGVHPGDPGVVPSGQVHGGIGQGAVPSWIAPVASFRIGAEEVLNTHLRIGDLHLQFADMLLGADFFLSHHIYVAASQRKVYFTYNGGPVFNLTNAPALQAAAGDQAGSAVPAAGASPPAPTAPALPPGTTPAQPATAAGEPTDAEGFSRRGAGFASRREYQRAIADFTRASELAPNDAGYLYERGEAELGADQPDRALADFDRALALKPDDAEMRVARAQLRLRHADTDAAVADLDAADHAVAPQAEIRLRLGRLYLRAGEFARAVAEYDQWLKAHEGDASAPMALGGRCRARVFLGQELAQALKDCNAALKRSPQTAEFLASRALVRLRLGELDAALADCDTALRLQPRSPWALYGRGVAKIRKGLSGAGQADIAAARALEPHIAELAARVGFAP